MCALQKKTADLYSSWPK